MLVVYNGFKFANEFLHISFCMESHTLSTEPVVAFSEKLPSKYPSCFESCMNTRPNVTKMFFRYEGEDVLCRDKIEMVDWKLIFFQSLLRISKVYIRRYGKFLKLRSNVNRDNFSEAVFQI